MNTERWVVLGSNSFSGSHFVDHLLDKKAEVIGMSRSPEPKPFFLPYKGNSRIGNFNFQVRDLNHDLDAIMNTISDFSPDYVVNFAAQSMVAESWATPEHWFQTNVTANVRLHDRLRKLKCLKKYVHVSTPEVYGHCTGIVREDHPFNPSTPYAVSRAACDLSLLSFFKHYGFPVTFTRAANVFGPGQQLYRIVPRTLIYAKLGKRLPLHGGGHSVRSFIHIRDVAEGTYRVAREGTPGETYHFSTDTQLPIREVVTRALATLGLRFEDHVQEVGERPGKDGAYLLDSSKARQQLNWNDDFGLELGLRQALEWVNGNWDSIQGLPLEYVHKA